MHTTLRNVAVCHFAVLPEPHNKTQRFVKGRSQRKSSPQWPRVMHMMSEWCRKPTQTHNEAHVANVALEQQPNGSGQFPYACERFHILSPSGGFLHVVRMLRACKLVQFNLRSESSAFGGTKCAEHNQNCIHCTRTERI